MTADQIGIIILVVLFVVGYAFRSWYKKQARSYKISTSPANGYILTIFDHNPRAEGATLELKCTAPVDGTLSESSFGIEIIRKKRELYKIFFADHTEMRAGIKLSEDQKTIQLLIEKKSLLDIIRKEEIKLNRFRFFIELGNNSFIKSPEFAFSSRFLIYKADTGKYN